MKPLYERQEGESKQAFEGFTIYRNLGLTRKLKDVGKKLGKNHSLVKHWSSQHNWVERAEAFDEEMDKRAILENAQLRKQMIKEHAEVSRKLLLKVKAAVEHIRPETLSPYEIQNYWKFQ
ncbi:phage terminase small subunit-related protein [Priestia flexa]|uniref:phage terminase small subunit-related protein n=1 Tax=Priestia flexa TaxID=86664 RepID=UPI00077C6EB9|nr:phage terminase small subunit-related protein [Priestia flexa]MED4588104.1 phage terminase small subunit-related protein [Priestia flexa]